MSNVIFTLSPTDILNDFLNKNKVTQYAVLIDENTEKHCLPILELINDPLIIKIPSGEQNKNLNTCITIWNALTAKSFTRDSLLINLGGGVIGDMGGFCAKTFKRGIKFINIPTTLLAQVDASIGGKLGIDFSGFKNHIGLFSEPEAVIISEVFLSTLPERELKSGFAEIIKHHLIADQNGWNKLINTAFTDINWSEIIKHSISIKQNVVQEDPLESGYRKVLNFGHTIGHAIESQFINSKSKLLHGEAVALGMTCEAHISYQKGFLSGNDLNPIKNYIDTNFYKPNLLDMDRQLLINMMWQDKKNTSDKIKCVLLDKIGKAIWDVDISEKEINDSLDYLNQT